MHREHREKQARSRQDFLDRPDDLRMLSHMDNWDTAEGEPDIRGWPVVDMNGDKLGKVEDLVVDSRTDEAVFALIGYGGGLGAGGKRTMMPLDDVELDEDNKALLTRGAMSTFEHAPVYEGGKANYTRYFDYWSGVTAAGSEARLEKIRAEREERHEEETRHEEAEERREEPRARHREGPRKVRVYRRPVQEERVLSPEEQALRRGEPVVIPVTEEKQVVTGEMVVEPEDLEEEEEEHVRHRGRE